MKKLFRKLFLYLFREDFKEWNKFAQYKAYPIHFMKKG